MSLYRDVMAEIELTMVPSHRTPLTPGMYVPASEPAEASRGGSTCRTFWCALKDQGVEVEFRTKRSLGFPRLVSVKRCSAFDEPDRVACDRRCLDSKFRRQWPFALPVAGKGSRLGG